MYIRCWRCWWESEEELMSMLSHRMVTRRYSAVRAVRGCGRHGRCRTCIEAALALIGEAYRRQWLGKPNVVMVGGLEDFHDHNHDI